jgi:hypothetical protein
MSPSSFEPLACKITRFSPVSLTPHYAGVPPASDLAILHWQRLMAQALTGPGMPSTRDEDPGMRASSAPAWERIACAAGWRDTTPQHLPSSPRPAPRCPSALASAPRYGAPQTPASPHRTRSGSSCLCTPPGLAGALAPAALATSAGARQDWAGPGARR